MAAKTFHVFKNASGSLEAVKQGVNWPAALFPYFWPLAAKLWLQAVAALFIFVVFGGVSVLLLVFRSRFPADLVEQFNFAFGMTTAVLGMIFGKTGNLLRERNLLARGFKLQGSVAAPDAKSALASFA